MKKVIGVWFLVLSLLGSTNSTYLRQDKPGEYYKVIMTNQKLTNSAILAQNSESRSFAILREPEGMVFDQTEQEQEQPIAKQDKQIQTEDEPQPYVQLSEGQYSNNSGSQEIAQQQSSQTQQVQSHKVVLENKSEGDNSTTEMTSQQEEDQPSTEQGIIPEAQIPNEQPEFQLVVAENDPTIILKSEEENNEKQVKSQKKTVWKLSSPNSKESSSLQSSESDKQKLIVTKFDDSLIKSDDDDNEDFTTLKLLPMGISKEQFLAMMPVEQDLLINPIPDLESYQSSNDIGYLGLNEDDILKEMCYSYDPPEIEQISQ